MRPEENLATIPEVSSYLGVTPNRLAKMRMDGEGPEFVRLGARTIRYEWAAVRSWVVSAIETSTEAYAV